MVQLAEIPSCSSPTCPNNSRINCKDCRLSSICLPISLHLDDISKLDSIVKRNRPLHKGSTLFNAGDTFTSLYAVRSGAIKTIRISQEGAEQITGFYLPGEILGIEGLASDAHTNEAIALETSAVCEIPFSRLEELSKQIDGLQRRMFQIMGKEVNDEQQLITLLSKNSAEERIAALLLSISTRNGARNLSASDFFLPMSRSDIGNFLGLTIETVSRVFTKFNKQGLITLDKKHVVIEDMAKLQQLAM